jgi:hypothetical protein
MGSFRRVLRVATVVAAVGALALPALGATARGDGRSLLETSLAPSMPSDPTFHGVAPGGLPWALDEGDARLERDGRLIVEVDGLVIPIEHTVGDRTFPPGTARPVKSVSASLFCGADSDTVPAATTKSVPITRGGDARVDDRIDLPDTCLAPIVMVHPDGNTAAYIAISGFRD